MNIQVNNEEGFERFKHHVIRNKNSCFAMFRMDGCGHCVELKPEWEKIKTKVPRSLILAEIDSDYSSKITDLIGSDEIMGYPTLTAIKGGKKIIEFSGDRTENELLKFIKNQFGNNNRGKRRKSRRRKSRRRKSRKRKSRRRQSRKRKKRRKRRRKSK